MYRSYIKFLLLLIFIPTISFAGITDFFKSGTSESLQHDLDITHLNDLVLLSDHIEKYKEVTGKYPFQGEVKYPHYVHITTKEQEQYAKGGPPYEHKRSSAKEFIKELQSKLGTEIQIPFDLQRVPVNKPNFYIYMVVGNTYYLAVHLHNNYSFANKVADYYNKLEVTNDTNAQRKGTWLRSELLANKEFISAKNGKPNKPDYMQNLRVKLGGNNAF